MAFPSAAGFPSHSGSYIPRLYAMAMLIAFYSATVFGEIANTEYEGELKKHGDTLRIRTLPDIDVNEYVKGQKLNLQTPEGSYIDLLIDKGLYWAMALADMDFSQMDIDHATQWAQHASRNLQIAIDTAILANITGDPHASNTGATAGLKSGDINLGSSGAPLALSADNILDVIIEGAGLVLDEQDAPPDDRWVVLPSWACAKLKLSDLKDASLTGDGKSTLRNGRIGSVDNFTIYRSNNLSSATDGSYTAFSAMFGQKCALAFASQMTKTETLRNQDDFGDISRSLQSYGYKTVKPEALGRLYIRKAA